MDNSKKIFEIINFFDKCRWSNNENYVLPDMDCKTEGSAKLLTQWIIYIVDRQMDSTKIATVGGPVFSYIASAFLKTKKEVSDFLKIGEGDINDCYYIKRGKSYCFNATNGNTFSSRFPLDDYRDLYFTFYTLKKCNPQEPTIENYISSIIKKVVGFKDWDNKSSNEKAMYLLRGVAYGLYLLTYFGNKKTERYQVDKSFLFDDLKTLSPNEMVKGIDVYSEKRFEKVKEHIDTLDKHIGYSADLSNNFELKQSALRFNMKRVWCPLRDFLKYQPLKALLDKALQGKGISNEIRDLLFLDSVKYLELPGDLWNERANFKRCLTSGNKKVDFDFYVRKIFEQEKIEIGYPEQFDITFNFVRRMCEKKLCHICPLGSEFEKVEFEKFCIGECQGYENKYCPYVALSCGYKHFCTGKDCYMLNFSKRK